ncbi:MAG: terminase gpA endonuclease subunit [Candidatus Ozemobacteraceae bacterium]
MTKLSLNSQQTTSLDNRWCEIWTPPANLNPWQWAEAELELSARITAQPGAYSTLATPYVREPLEAFADPAIRKIILCWSAQSSKTTTLTAALAYAIANSPGPALYVFPSLEMARSFSENRLMPLINDCPVLARHKTHDRHDFKKTELILSRQTIYLQGANPNQLSSRPVKYLFLDETDKFDAYDTQKSEADLISLAVERTKSYRDHKIVITSTPTIPENPIWVQFKSGDQRYFHIPCPICGTFFKLEWRFVKWPDIEDIEKIRNNTWLECPHCAGRIEEKSKNRLLSGGTWQAENPTGNPDTRSYHLNELYSPITRWGTLAVKFIEATKEAKKGLCGPLHNFVNSSLAEPWEVIQEDRKPDAILSFRDLRPRFTVPNDVVLGVTAGIDTQDNGFWYAIYGWGRDLEAWLLAEGFADSWETLESSVFKSIFISPSGQKHIVCSAFIDSSGHRTKEVYDYCRRNKRAKPIKGEQELSGPWKVTTIDTYPGTNNPMPSGIHLIRINTQFYKDTLASKLELLPEQPGAIHFHKDISADFTSHMAAEYRDGKGIWRCAKHKRRDLWDCSVYAMAAADMFRIQLRRTAAGVPSQTPAQAPTPKRDESNPYLRGTQWENGGNPFQYDSGNPYIRR